MILIFLLYRYIEFMSFSPEEQEIQIVQHWFRNWSESQRLKFLTFFVEKIEPSVTNLECTLENLSFEGQSPTIFQCQLRQFSSWFDHWSFEGKKKFKIKLLEVDPNFISLLNQSLNN